MLSKQCSVVKEEEESIHSPIKITDQNIVSQIEGKTPELSMKKAITPHPLPPLFLPQLLGKDGFTNNFVNIHVQERQQ